MIRRWQYIVLILIFLLAAAVRWVAIDRNGLWYDELASLSCAAGSGLWHETIASGDLMSPAPRPTHDDATPSTSFWASFNQEQHPPLYFLILRGWQHMTGSSDTAVRALTVIFALLAVWFTFDAARLWFGWSTALWAAALVAVATPMVEASLQVRNYVPMVACVTAVLALTARIDLRGASITRLVYLGAAATAAMLTHYFAIGAIAAAALYLVIVATRDRTRVALTFIAAAVLFAIIWGPALLRQRANFERNRGYLAATSDDHASLTLKRVARAPINLLADPRTDSWALMFSSALMFVIPFALFRRNRAMLLLALGLSLPILLVAALDVARRTEQLSLTRYILAAAPAAYILVPAIGATVLRSRVLAAALPAAAVVFCSIALMNGDAYRVNASNPGDYRPLAKGFDQHTLPGDAAVFIGGSRGNWYGRWLYLAMSHYAQRWPTTAMVLDRTPSADELQRLQQCDGLIVVHGPGAQHEGWFEGFAPSVTVEEPFAGAVTKFVRKSESK